MIADVMNDVVFLKDMARSTRISSLYFYSACEFENEFSSWRYRMSRRNSLLAQQTQIESTSTV